MTHKECGHGVGIDADLNCHDCKWDEALRLKMFGTLFQFALAIPIIAIIALMACWLK